MCFASRPHDAVALAILLLTDRTFSFNTLSEMCVMMSNYSMDFNGGLVS